jgi:hypothetical protein
MRSELRSSIFSPHSTREADGNPGPACALDRHCAIAVGHLLQPPRINFDLEVTPFELEQHRRQETVRRSRPTQCMTPRTSRVAGAETLAAHSVACQPARQLLKQASARLEHARRQIAQAPQIAAGAFRVNFTRRCPVLRAGAAMALPMEGDRDAIGDGEEPGMSIASHTRCLRAQGRR